MFFKRIYIGQTDFYAVYYDRIEGLPYCAEKSSALEKGYRGVRSPVYYLLSLLFLFFVITGFGKTPITGWLSVLFHNVFFKVFFLAFFYHSKLTDRKKLIEKILSKYQSLFFVL